LPGFQILRDTPRLANFIRWVAAQRLGERVALLLNGDVIDTLAEDIPGYVAFDEAVSIVQRIMQDTSFKPVWEALAHFVHQEGRSLIIVIGNHDIELAFPQVQRLIVTCLARADLAARARIEFVTTGAGYTCSVGNAQVFCTHGNEVDPWNYVRYEDLSKAARRLNTGRSLSVSEWEPNAGTKMVKDVMNDVKRKYRWIDLLKPELQAAVGTLLVLSPEQLGKFTSVLPIIGEKRRGDAQIDQRLSADGYQSAPASRANADVVNQLLGPNLRDGLQHTGGRGDLSADDMLLATEQNFANPGGYVSAAEGTLGTGQLLWDRLTGWITGVGQDEALRRALKDWIKDDLSFQIDTQDDTYKEITRSVGSSVDILVTGHTHLERAITMGAGRYYFNCGTWIRLLRLTDKNLQNRASFKPVYDVLVSGRMEAIDAAIFDQEAFVLDRSSAVSIMIDGNTVVGQLLHVEGDGTLAPRVIQTFTRP
jgi:UDP-2,3-diacylglucosamine pyrophosphatase LpxH